MHSSHLLPFQLSLCLRIVSLAIVLLKLGASASVVLLVVLHVEAQVGDFAIPEVFKYGLIVILQVNQFFALFSFDVQQLGQDVLKVTLARRLNGYTRCLKHFHNEQLGFQMR